MQPFSDIKQRLIVKTDKRLTFKIKFTCKCGNNDSDRFIASEENNTSLILLCPYCERRYDLSVQSKEIKL